MQNSVALRRLHGRLSRADDKQLADFFEKLTAEQIDQLLALPSEEMHQALQRLYLRQFGRGRPPRRSGFHPEDGWRPRPPGARPPPKQRPGDQAPPETDGPEKKQPEKKQPEKAQFGTPTPAVGT